MLFLGVILLTGILSGYSIGRAISPVYDGSDEGRRAILSYVARLTDARSYPNEAQRSRLEKLGLLDEYLEFEKRQLADGRISAVLQNPDEIYFTCRERDFVYNIEAKKVEIRASPSRESRPLWRVPRRKLQFSDALTAFITRLERYQLRETLPNYLEFLRHEKRESGLKGIPSGLIKGIAETAMTFSGAGIGVYLGYENDPDCSEKHFQDLLLSHGFWHDAERSVRERSSWFFLYDLNGNPYLDKKRGAGRFRIEERGNLIFALNAAGIDDWRLRKLWLR